MIKKAFFALEKAPKKNIKRILKRKKAILWITSVNNCLSASAKQPLLLLPRVNFLAQTTNGPGRVKMLLVS